MQVVFVDDGSTDESVEIIESMPIDGFSKVILRQTNAGQSAARNHALAWISETRPGFDGYVMFLDSDDMLPADSIESACCEMAKWNLDQLYFTGGVFYESDKLQEEFAHYSTYYKRNGAYVGLYTGPEYMEETVKRDDFYPSPAMQMTSYRFLEEHGIKFYEGIIHEDNLFTLTCLLHASRVAYIDKPLYSRRIRSDSTMTKPARPENVIGYFRCGEQALWLPGLECLTRGEREAFCSVIGSWFSAAADYYCALSETARRSMVGCFGARSELLFQQTVQLRVSAREALSESSEKAKRDGYTDGYEKARLEFLASRSYRIGRAITAIPRKIMQR